MKLERENGELTTIGELVLVVMIAALVAAFIGLFALLAYFSEAPVQSGKDWLRDELREWLMDDEA